MIIRKKTVVIGSILFVTLILLYKYHFSSRYTFSFDKNLWHKEVAKFYDEASQRIIETLRKKGYRAVRLLPELNRTKYHISMPCNEGLARNLKKALDDLNLDRHVEVVFWKGDICSVQGWIGSIFLSGRDSGDANNYTLISPKGKWYRIKSGNANLIEHEFIPINELPSNTLNIRLIVKDIQIDKQKYRFNAKFAIEKGNGDQLFEHTYSGSIQQIRWFLEKKLPKGVILISVILFFLAFAMFLWLFFGRLVFPGRFGFRPEFEILLLCITGACLYMLFNINPFERENAKIYEPYNLVFMIDKNSAIFFPHGNKENKKGLVDIIKCTCQEILALDKFKLSAPKYTYNFWTWFKKRLPLLLNKRQKYELNSKAGYLIHLVFGEEPGRKCFGYHNLTSTIEAAQKCIKAIDYNIGNNVGARLVIPEEELNWIKKNEGLELQGIKYVVFFTSSSTDAPPEAVKRYYGRAITLADDSVKVFSIFLPTIPRTGDRNKKYDYEEGKLDLLRSVSDYVVSINDSGIDLGVDSVIPIFHHDDLGIASAEKWDVPCDLDNIRRVYFLQLNEDELQRKSKEIAHKFDKFVSNQDRREALKREYLVHTLIKKKSGVLTLLSITLILIGFFIFYYYRYDSYWLHEWQNSPKFRFMEYVCLFLSYVIMIVSYFLVLYRADNPQQVSLIGYPDLAFTITIDTWLLFFIGPHLMFALYWDGDGRNSVMKWHWAMLTSLFFIMIMLLIPVFMPYMINSLFWRYMMITISVFIASVLIIGILHLLRGHISSLPQLFVELRPVPDPGPLPWWTRPLGTFIIKNLFWFLLIFPINGSLLATPYSPLRFPFVDVFYSGLIFEGAIFWVLMGGVVWLSYKNLGGK